MTKRLDALRLLLCAPFLLPAIAFASPTQEPASTDGKQETGERPIERLKAWPKLASKSKTSKEVQRLRKASTEAMGAEALVALRSIGAAATPLLIQALGKERDEKASARLITVMDEITTAAHTRLLAQSFSDKSEQVRSWALRRCSALPDPGNRAAAEKALATCTDPDRRKPASAQETYLAALCATATGSLQGMSQIEGKASKSWKTCGRELRRALEQVRGPQATALLLPRLAKAPRAEAVTLMRLLAGCGDRSAGAPLRPFLDNSDNSLRVAAINALRGVVDGQDPLEKLPVFRAIELAKEWKARL